MQVQHSNGLKIIAGTPIYCIWKFIYLRNAVHDTKLVLANLFLGDFW